MKTEETRLKQMYKLGYNHGKTVNYLKGMLIGVIITFGIFNFF